MGYTIPNTNSFASVKDLPVTALGSREPATGPVPRIFMRFSPAQGRKESAGGYSHLRVKCSIPFPGAGESVRKPLTLRECP